MCKIVPDEDAANHVQNIIIILYIYIIILDDQDIYIYS